MSDKRHRQPVGDSLDGTSIDRDLAELLSIEPSPEFAAGVRRRIQDARALRRAPFRWWAAVAAAAALALLVMFASRASRMEEEPRQATTPPPSDVVLKTVPGPTPVATAPARGLADMASRPRVRSVPARSAKEWPVEPEVLVPRDRLRAIERLQDLIVAGTLTEKDLPRLDGDAPAVGDIRPAPLTIPPLTVPDVGVVAGPVSSTGRSRR